MAKAKNIKQEEIILTQEGFDKIQKELEQRRTKTRNEIANKLDTAAEQGDLSENAAYKSALEEKELNEARIRELEDMLSKAKVKSSKSKSKTVSLGSNVTLSINDKKEMKLKIVGQSESNPSEGKITMDSPIVKAIYGKNKNYKTKVELPHKKINIVIKNIN